MSAHWRHVPEEKEPRGRRAGRIRRWTRRVAAGLTGDSGMSTAEYAVGTIAACGFAAVLYKVVTSGLVGDALERLIEQALHAKS